MPKFNLKSWLYETIKAIPNDVSDADIRSVVGEVLAELEKERKKNA